MNICEQYTGRAPLTDEEIREAAPLSLAYVGDTIFDLYLRSRLVVSTDQPVSKLHKRASAFANASAQARLLKSLEESLSPEEAAVARKGRNARVHTIPKHATPADYHLATGFEALLGYLFLTGRDERLMEILQTAVPDVRKEH